jgi:hypothetical protein
MCAWVQEAGGLGAKAARAMAVGDKDVRPASPSSLFAAARRSWPASLFPTG